MQNTNMRTFLLFPILTGLLIGISYPPLPFGFVAWFGFLPLWFCLKDCGLVQSFKYGYLSGMVAHFVSLYWIGFNSGAGVIPVFLSLIGAVLYLSIYWGLFATGFTYLINQGKFFIWLVPFLWVSMEWVRSFGPLGFSWMDLALTQSSYLSLIQILDMSGPSGISLWILLLNVLFYHSVKTTHNKIVYFSSIGIIVFSLWILGEAKIKSIEEHVPSDSLAISVTQPSIDPNEKWEKDKRQFTFDLMHDLLNKALELKPDMVLWPETALPSYLRLSRKDRQPIQKKVNDSRIPLLSGTIDRDMDDKGQNRYFNGSIFFKPGTPHKMYHKVHLVPFAEYVPLSKWFPKLNDLNFGQGNFSSGNEFTQFMIKGHLFSNLICFESSLPDVVRTFVKKGAEFVTIQANDGWLGKTTGPFQHFEIAKLRAIENRRTIVRSANTGISGIILPTGKIKERKSLGERVVFKSSIPLFKSMSYFTIHGNILGKWSTLIIVMSSGIMVWKTKR